MTQPEQNLKNHARIDPLFHYVLIWIFMLNLIFCAIHFAHARDWFSGWLVVLAVGLFLLLYKTRIYPLKAQDRVIRLEERLRLSLLATADFRPRIAELTEAQLIALRFASDDEMPLLAAQALDQHLDGKEIKKRIVGWRADYFRV